MELMLVGVELPMLKRLGVILEGNLVGDWVWVEIKTSSRGLQIGLGPHCFISCAPLRFLVHLIPRDIPSDLSGVGWRTMGLRGGM